MTVTPVQKRVVLYVALALAVAVGAVFGDNAPAPVAPETNPAQASSPPAAEPESNTALAALESYQRSAPASDNGVDIFASKSWNAPPPPTLPAKHVPPPKPTAPPLPFSYVGQMEGKDGLMIYLARGEELLSVKPGAQFDENYRLEAASPEQLTFIYLPLRERQVLGVGVKP